MKRTPLIRRTPMKRGGALRRHNRIPSRSPRRIREELDYLVEREAFLRAHPYCQAWLLLHGIRDEAAFLQAVAGTDHVKIDGEAVPRATQVHHRNKRRAGRLLDQRWWMALSPGLHDRIERDKRWARRTGLLLPFEADSDGRLPDGTVCATTDELLRRGAPE